VEPLAPERYKVQFTASAGLRAKLEHLQALMRTAVPDGDLATLVELAVTEKIERLEAQRFGRVKTPRKTIAETDMSPSSRRIPAPVRRAVHERDEGRCTYVDGRGRRCTARERLEFHHREPFGRGGDHSLGNLALTCRAHNALMAERDYGKETMARHRRSGQSDRSAGQVPEPTAAPGRDDRQGSRLRRRESGPAPGRVSGPSP
jgi:5-methylcytosine-specific restriction endonuclease McrA